MWCVVSTVVSKLINCKSDNVSETATVLLQTTDRKWPIKSHPISLPWISFKTYCNFCKCSYSYSSAAVDEILNDLRCSRDSWADFESRLGIDRVTALTLMPSFQWYTVWNYFSCCDWVWWHFGFKHDMISSTIPCTNNCQNEVYTCNKERYTLVMHNYRPFRITFWSF